MRDVCYRPVRDAHSEKILRELGHADAVINELVLKDISQIAG